jgi:predicted amidohydrolase YtcJ
MTRVHDDGLPEGGWNPTQKLTLAEMLRGYTAGSAWGVSRDDELGALEPGKLADIIIIDRDLFSQTPEQIREASVNATIVDGKVVFNRSVLSI